jgi:hypothetical protein
MKGRDTQLILQRHSSIDLFLVLIALLFAVNFFYLLLETSSNLSKNRAEACEVLVAHGASLAWKCFGKTVQEVLKEEMPYFDATKVARVATNPALGKRNLSEQLSNILDRAQRNQIKDLSNAHNLIMYSVYLQQADTCYLNTADAFGMSLMQKGCSHGLHEFVACMINHDMDPEATSPECSSKPVLLAAYHGFNKVLSVLKEHRLKAGGSTGTTNFAVIERPGTV